MSKKNKDIEPATITISVGLSGCKHAMIQNFAIYECDKCGYQTTSWRKFLKHKKTCGGDSDANT